MWMRLGLADVMANDYQKLASLAAPVNIKIYGPRQTQELVDVAFRYIDVPYSVFAAESSVITCSARRGRLLCKLRRALDS